PTLPGWEHIGTDLGAYSRLFRNSGVSPCNQLASRVKRSVTSSSPSRISRIPAIRSRSEEHTSELQSLRHLVCRLLLEKKKMIHPHTPVYNAPLPRQHTNPHMRPARRWTRQSPQTQPPHPTTRPPCLRTASTLADRVYI